MVEQFWELVASFVAGPQTNGLAQAIAGFFVFVLGWRAMPLALETLPPFSPERAGRRALRGIAALVLIAIIVLATATAVGMLADRR
ncbi:MAG: hypothetical protein RIM84_18620 [Alphaproteobacteria bacterium]